MQRSSVLLHWVKCSRFHNLCNLHWTVSYSVLATQNESILYATVYGRTAQDSNIDQQVLAMSIWREFKATQPFLRPYYSFIQSNRNSTQRGFKRSPGVRHQLPGHNLTLSDSAGLMLAGNLFTVCGHSSQLSWAPWVRGGHPSRVQQETEEGWESHCDLCQELIS